MFVLVKKSFLIYSLVNNDTKELNYMMNFKKIFEPGKIGSLDLKNRLVVPPMLTEYADKDGNLTERYIRYYEEKAKGGFGLIITEDNAIEPRGAGFPNLPGLWEGINFEKHKELTSRIKKHGAKIFVQIYHAGREASQDIIGLQPVAPSPIHDPAIYEIPHELSIEEIEELENKFVYSIIKAKESGYDGVELHGAHGYLINQFVSPFSNKRTDKYGGNLENRMRFPLNIIKKAFDKVGNDYTITYRISADEFVEGGLTIEDSKIIGMILEQQGIKAIHVSGGVYKTGHLPSAPYQAKTALFSDLAKEVKTVLNIPVIAVNKINTPYVAESILNQGKADFVAIGRASIADPYFPKKILEGKIDDIIPCIACDQGCQGKIAKGEPVSCLVNPRTGREDEYNLDKVDNAKKVMVIGGGLAGMQAAIVAAQKGHYVEIFEKSNRLGGQWLFASIPPSKEIFNSFVIYLKNQIEKLNIKLRLNTEVTKETIDTFHPDHIILATGAKPLEVKFSGMDTHLNVVQANDILSGKTLPEKEIVVIGGGLVGVETAEHLAVHGAKVSVVEMKNSHLEEMPGMPKAFMLESLEHNKVQIHLGTKVEEIKSNCLVVSKTNRIKGNSYFEEIYADQIVLAIGSKLDNSLEETLKDKYNYTKVGDITGVADGIKAIKEGYEAGLNI